MMLSISIAMSRRSKRFKFFVDCAQVRFLKQNLRFKHTCTLLNNFQETKHEHHPSFASAAHRLPPATDDAASCRGRSETGSA
jgi:hypothetical protein